MTSTSTSHRIDNRALYELSDPFSNKALRLETGGLSDSLTIEQAIAVSWGKPAELQLLLKLKGYRGSQAADVLWTALPPLKCISLKAIAAFSDQGLTGWSTFPVEVFDRKGVHLPQYRGLAISSYAGRRDPTKSAIIDKPSPVPSGKPHQVYRGLYFDEAQWDGADFFYVEGFLIVTKTVRDTIISKEITNVRLTPLAEVEIDVSLDRFDP